MESCNLENNETARESYRLKRNRATLIVPSGCLPNNMREKARNSLMLTLHISYELQFTFFFLEIRRCMVHIRMKIYALYLHLGKINTDKI